MYNSLFIMHHYEVINPIISCELVLIFPWGEVKVAALFVVNQWVAMAWKAIVQWWFSLQVSSPSLGEGMGVGIKYSLTKPFWRLPLFQIIIPLGANTRVLRLFSNRLIISIVVRFKVDCMLKRYRWGCVLRHVRRSFDAKRAMLRGIMRGDLVHLVM